MDALYKCFCCDNLVTKAELAIVDQVTCIYCIDKSKEPAPSKQEILKIMRDGIK